jgi:glycosyltransferase involved in cell wall biosynthesis
MKVLFVAFEFPPIRLGGVFRIKSIAEYLAKNNVDVTVLTLAKKSYPNVYGSSYNIDENLVKVLPQNIKLIEIESSNLLHKSKLRKFKGIYFSIHGEETKNWSKRILSDKQLINSFSDVDVILCSAPPFGALKLASKLSKNLKKPLVLDFRDAWSQWIMNPYGSYFHYLATLFYERKYLKQAKAVITTSEVTSNDFLKLHTKLDPLKVHTILNGFDGEISTYKQENYFNKQKIIVGYVGSFYYNPNSRDNMLTKWYKKKGHRILQYAPNIQDWLYRTPYFFFKMLCELRIENKLLFDKIKVEFIGRQESWLKDMISEFNLENSVFLLGEKTREESIKFQQQCDFLLITSSKRLDGDDYSIAGKTFEYVQTQKPILAFVCNGAQKDLLEKTGIALIFDPDKKLNNSKLFQSLLNNNIKLTPQTTFNLGLSRENQLEKLKTILNF